MKKASIISLIIILLPVIDITMPPIALDTPSSLYDQTIFEWSRTWAEVMQLVRDKHYKIANPAKSIAKGIDAFLNDIDPHSNFLDAESYKDMTKRMNGSFDGIGIIIDNTRKTKDNFLTAVEIIPDGPAEKAGLRQYDKIVEIDSKVLGGMTTEQAIALLKGKRGTIVTVKVLREGQSDLVSIPITRDVVKEQLSTNFYIKNHNILYFSLTTFTSNAVHMLEKTLKHAQKKPYNALIMDLRNNSGGLLTSAVDIASLFLDKGSVVVVTKDKNNQETERHTTPRNPIANQSTPIFILINNFTASAAEILAGSLALHANHANGKDSLRIFLVGTPSFGKGSVQEVIPVNNNCAIKLTTSLYFLAYDTAVQGLGVQPDFTVQRCNPPTEQTVWLTQNYGREATLENHIKIEPTSTQKTASCAKQDEKPKAERWHERIKKMLQTDNQLKEAINLANTLAVAQAHTPELVQDRKTALAYLQQSYVNQEELELEEVKL